MKNNISRKMLRKLSAGSIMTGSALLALGLHPALAQSYNYTGGAAGTATAPITGTMNLPTSWAENAKPPSAAATNLFFGGSGGTAYTATQNAYTTFGVNTLTFNSSDTVTEIIAGGTNSFNFLGTAGTTGIIQNGSGAFAINSAFSGTNGLTFSGMGSGLITIGSASSALTGGVTVKSGNIKLAAGAQTFGNSTNLITINGGSLDTGGIAAGSGFRIAGLAGTGGTITSTVTGSPNVLNIFGNTGGTYSGNITGNLSINLAPSTGSIAETLSGTNTYTGTTAIGSGATLSVGEPTAGGTVTALSTGLITINSGGQLRLNGPGGTPTAEYLPNSFAFNGGTLTGVDGVQHLATGTGSTFAVGGTNSTFTTEYPSKDIYVDGQMTGSGALTVNNYITASFDGQGIVHFTNATNTYSGTVTSAANTGITSNTYSGGVISVDSGTALQLANVVNNSGSSNTYTGSGGTNSQTFQNLAGIQFGPAVTSATFGSLAGAGNFALTNTATSPGAVTLTEGNGGTTTYSGVISGSGGLTQVGSGTALTLSGANTYAGGTTVNGGTLTAAADGTLGSGNVSVGTNGVLTLTGGTTNNYINDTASLLLTSSNNSTPFVNLSFTGTDLIGNLSFDNGLTFAQAGTYGGVGSGALFTNSDFSGNGILSVTGLAAAPEPSQAVALGLGMFGLAVLGLRARRRSNVMAA